MEDAESGACSSDVLLHPGGQYLTAGLWCWVALLERLDRNGHSSGPDAAASTCATMFAGRHLGLLRSGIDEQAGRKAPER